MQLIRWTPRSRLALRDPLFSTVIDEFFSPAQAERRTSPTGLVPSVDIYEKDDKVFFEAELPGFNKDDLKVDVHGKVLTLRGERKMETEGGGNHFRKERRYGTFERSFHLGFEADSELVEAKYENGILTVIVGKPQEVKAKQIEIH